DAWVTSRVVMSRALRAPADHRQAGRDNAMPAPPATAASRPARTRLPERPCEEFALDVAARNADVLEHVVVEAKECPAFRAALQPGRDAIGDDPEPARRARHGASERPGRDRPAGSRPRRC